MDISTSNDNQALNTYSDISSHNTLPNDNTIPTLPTGTPVTVAQARKQTSGDDCDAVENNQAASWTKETGQMNTQITDRNDIDNNKIQSGMPQYASQNSQQNLLPSSSLATLQPYEDNQDFAVANNKKKHNRQRKNKRTKIKLLMLISNNNHENVNFTKYYSVVP